MTAENPGEPVKSDGPDRKGSIRERILAAAVRLFGELGYTETTMERIAAEADDPTCGVLLLDLVLGHGAHADPAGELADAIRAARSKARDGGRVLPVVVSVTGTEGDPQGLTATCETLAAAGASVFLSNRDATRHALTFLGATR